MRFQLVLSSLAATAVADFVWKPAPGGILSGCTDTMPGTIDLIRAAPEKLRKRDEVYPYPGQPVALEKLTLKNGILKDREGRIGSVVANFQFQFDGPEPQDQAFITRGFSVCKNNTLALGQSTQFEECDAGANFWNLYYFFGLDTSGGRPMVCRPVRFLVPPPGGLGAKTVNSIVYVTESVTPLGDGYGYGTATGTGAYGYGTATGGAGTAKGTAKDATAKTTGTATGTGARETGLSTGKEAKGAKGTAGAAGNATTSLTTSSTDLPTTTPAANLTTSDAPKPPPATPAPPGPKSTSNGAAGYKSHSVALLVGLLGVALL